MIEWIVMGAAALGASGWAYRVTKRGRVHAKWKSVIEAASLRIDGRPSTGSRFDAPEMRAEIDGITVTLRIIGIEGHESEGRVVATATLPDRANTVRFYFGWDVLEEPVSVAHVAEVPYPPIQRVSGDVKIRADNAAMASRFLKEAIVDLIDVRREADAKALEVIAKGGYLELVLHGLWSQPELLERATRTCVRLGAVVDRISREVELPATTTTSDDAPAPAVGPCALCEADRGPDEDWVTCRSCGAAHHTDCFSRATACVKCGGVTPRPG